MSKLKMAEDISNQKDTTKTNWLSDCWTMSNFLNVMCYFPFIDLQCSNYSVSFKYLLILLLLGVVPTAATHLILDSDILRFCFRIAFLKLDRFE